MRHFKVPIIVTCVALVLALIVSVVVVTSIHNSKGSSRSKALRAQQAGAGVAVATCLVIAPFWLFAAAKVGKARREARDQARRRDAATTASLPTPRSTPRR